MQRQTEGWLEKQLAVIGVNLVTREFRDTDWMMNSEKGNFQMLRWGWIADYPDPEDFVMLLYGKNNRLSNVSGYSNPDYDKLYEQMRGMDDSPERLAIVKRMRNIANEDCPLAYYQHDAGLAIRQHWIHNYDPNPLAYDSPQYIRIDGAERAAMQAQWNRPIYWPIFAFVALIAALSVPAGRVVNGRKNRRIRIAQEGQS